MSRLYLVSLQEVWIKLGILINEEPSTAYLLCKSFCQGNQEKVHYVKNNPRDMPGSFILVVVLCSQAIPSKGKFSF